MIARFDPAAADGIVARLRAEGEPVRIVGEAIAGSAGTIEVE